MGESHSCYSPVFLCSIRSSTHTFVAGAFVAYSSDFLQFSRTSLTETVGSVTPELRPHNTQHGLFFCTQDPVTHMDDGLDEMVCSGRGNGRLGSKWTQGKELEGEKIRAQGMQPMHWTGMGRQARHWFGTQQEFHSEDI